MTAPARSLPLSLPSVRRIDDIELLRAFAVLLVVFEHMHGNLITWDSPTSDFLHRHFNGGMGVDLFFAISGFVIARDLLPRLTACLSREEFFRVTIAFWIRRTWRILPSAWLWLALILLATRVWNQSGVFRSFDATAAGSIAALLQFYNLHFAHCFMRYDCGTNFVYWSLSLEEQFYLVLPGLIFICRAHPLILQGVLLGLVGWQVLTERSLLLAMFRSDALLLGVLIALNAARPGPRSTTLHLMQRLGYLRLPLILGLIALAGNAAASAPWLGGLIPYRFGGIALLAALLVWIAAGDHDLLLPPGLLKRVLLWVGSRAYGLYLIHIPVFYATREFWYRHLPQGTSPDASGALPLVLTAGLLTGVLAELNFRIVETPLRRYGVAVAARHTERSTSVH